MSFIRVVSTFLSGPRWGLPEWHRWLHGQDWDYQSGPDGYQDMMGTTRVTQMATWPRVGQPECPGCIHGNDGDWQSGPDGYMAKMGGLPEWQR